ncbi:MAG: nitrate/nitrite transporter NrtS [Novosphingobium sp.]|nr:nitrate/nitrite transporter NrtS [Novosphingobium sp.]
MTSPREASRLAFFGPILRRSLAVSLIVGTFLNAINQGPEVASGKPLVLSKLLLTCCMPFCVANHGAFAALRKG